MSVPPPQSEHSVGIAYSLMSEFFPCFQGQRESLSKFFSQDAKLVFMDSQANGIEEIIELFSKMDDIEINVAGYHVQTVQAPRTWTMIVFNGSLLSSDGISDFHSSVFVEADQDECTAFIKFMTFKTF